MSFNCHEKQPLAKRKLEKKKKHKGWGREERGIRRTLDKTEGLFARAGQEYQHIRKSSK